MKRKRLAQILVAVLLPLVAMEVSLQILAWIAWRQNARTFAAEQGDDPGARRVLCVGDSFTFGSGAETVDGSYPRHLERILFEQTGDDGVRWSVINGGMPGRNSGELVQRLPGFLRREEPDYVCILIGLNDRWSRAEMDLPLPSLEEGVDEDFGAWRWRFRIPRLIAVASAQREAPSDQPESRAEPFESATPSNRSIPGVLKPVRTPDPEDREVRQRIIEAQARFRSEGPEALREALDALEPEVRQADDRGVTETFLGALVRLRNHERLIAACEAANERFGESALVYRHLVDALARVGRHDDALRAGERALEMIGDGPVDPALWRNLGLAHLRADDWPGAIDCYLRGFAVTGDVLELEGRLSNAVSGDRKRMLGTTRARLAEFGLDQNQVAQAEEVIDRILGVGGADSTGSGPFARLPVHLAHMAELVRQSGAHPVLLTYPGGINEDIRQAAMNVAADENVALVPTHVRMSELLRTANRDVYFIADGHCTGEGYSVMAGEVANTLRKIESERGSGHTGE